MQADRVDDRDSRLRIGGCELQVRRRGTRIRGWLVATKLGGLHLQRALSLGPDLLERRAAPGCGGGRHRALHQRGLAHHYASVTLHQLDRHLGAHQRAAQVHEHEHAVIGHRPLDRRAHALGVGADRAVVEPAGLLQRELLAAHLARERDDAAGQLSGVGDDDDPYHGAASLIDPLAQSP